MNNTSTTVSVVMDNGLKEIETGRRWARDAEELTNQSIKKMNEAMAVASNRGQGPLVSLNVSSRSRSSLELPRVLVVDDEEGPRQSIELICSDRFQVETAKSGYEALEKIAEQEFDVAVIDIRMGGMDGIELLQQIRKLSPNTRPIVMTAFITPQSLKRALEISSIGYLEKPFDAKEMLETIYSVMHANRP